MLMAGKNITTPNDVMQPIDVTRIINALQNPNTALAQQVQQLRALRLMDINQYKRLKTQLPYFVSSTFVPAIRRKENFAYALYFVIDIDHITSLDKNLDTIKQQLQQDEQILLMFTSPSNDGLKLLFKLQYKITDYAYYSLFYKKFAIQFTQKHQLQGMVDIKTNDASRCCFMSHDTAFYYNANCLEVNNNAYLNPNEINQLDLLVNDIKEAEKEYKQIKIDNNLIPQNQPTTLEDDILLRIKQRIKPNLISLIRREVVQPKELDTIWQTLIDYLQNNEIALTNTKPISYGRQIRVAAGKHWAELNIFFGKKGFTIVATTKTGSNASLATMCQQLLQQFFNL